MRNLIKIRVIRATICAGIALFFSCQAHAAEALYFSAIPPGSEAARALSLLENAAPEAAALRGSQVTMATTDLNGDSADELFLKITRPPGPACPGSGPGSGPCPALFFVFGLGNGKLFLIGQFSGTRILVADSRTFGTRDIQVFDDPLDDFHSNRYVWTPAQRRYTPWNLDSPALLEDK